MDVYKGDDLVKKLVDVAKKHKAALDELSSRVSAIECGAGAHVPVQSDAVAGGRDDVIYKRFTRSSVHNRVVRDSPTKIAFAAYLMRVKGITTLRIVECGLLSQSKAYALAKWEQQHLLDFCALNNVIHIYQDGLPDETVKQLLTPDGYDCYVNFSKRT